MGQDLKGLGAGDMSPQLLRMSWYSHRALSSRVIIQGYPGTLFRQGGLPHLPSEPISQPITHHLLSPGRSCLRGSR